MMKIKSPSKDRNEGRPAKGRTARIVTMALTPITGPALNAQVVVRL